MLEEFHISHLRKSPAMSLSGGERRRLEIARALASRPHYMLLDEPFAGIDPIAVADIQQLVRHLTTRGIGVLITDHNVRETLKLIDRAYIIHNGEILKHGTADDIIGDPMCAGCISARILRSSDSEGVPAHFGQRVSSLLATPFAVRCQCAIAFANPPVSAF